MSLVDLATYAEAVRAKQAAAQPLAPSVVTASGTLANRPAPGAVQAGSLYFVIDATADGGWWRSDGAAWTLILMNRPGFVGLYGKTPVARPAAIADRGAAGALYDQAYTNTLRDGINAILAALRAKGDIAT